MAKPYTADDLEDRLLVEFVDDSRDRLQTMYRAVERVSNQTMPPIEAIAALTMDAHNLKGCGTAFGYPAVSLVAHRLEDYLRGLTHLTDRQIEDITVFLDRTAALVDRAEQPALAETNQIVRSLPVRYIFEIQDVEVHDVEIMLVTPSKVVAKKIATEMAACGFRPVTVHDPIESISLAVRVPPDMIIASLVMEGLSGLDLIRGLRAMSVTRQIPMALLTSLELNNPSLNDIPAGVGVIRAGSHFGDDFATVITRFNLG